MDFTHEEQELLISRLEEMMIDFDSFDCDDSDGPYNMAVTFFKTMKKADFLEGKIPFYQMIDLCMDQTIFPAWMEKESFYKFQMEQLNKFLDLGYRDYWTYRLLDIYHQLFPDIKMVMPKPPTHQQVTTVDLKRSEGRLFYEKLRHRQELCMLEIFRNREKQLKAKLDTLEQSESAKEPCDV